MHNHKTNSFSLLIKVSDLVFCWCSCLHHIARHCLHDLLWRVCCLQVPPQFDYVYHFWSFQSQVHICLFEQKSSENVTLVILRWTCLFSSHRTINWFQKIRYIGKSMQIKICFLAIEQQRKKEGRTKPFSYRLDK